jgi:hypothetical protein
MDRQILLLLFITTLIVIQSKGIESKNSKEDLKLTLELEETASLSAQAFKELGETPDKINATLETLRNLLKGTVIFLQCVIMHGVSFNQ